MLSRAIIITALCAGLCSADQLARQQPAWPFSLWRKGDKPKSHSTRLPDFYHTTPSMANEVTQLATSGKCPGLSVELEYDEETTIQIAKYKAPETEAKFKTMVVGGEHARELIGSEIALNFVKALCGQAPSEHIAEAKKDTEFLIVMNANPGSREMVEKGDFCTRVNRNKVDINRNFDVDWENADTDNVDTNPGDHAFDQAESRILKKLLEKFQPHAYLDLHSGFKGMFFSNGVAGDNNLSMQLQRLVAPVDDKVCKCPLGIANAQVGYHTSGSGLDYAFMKAKVPFTVAVEVFLDDQKEVEKLEDRWTSQKQNLLAKLKTGSSFLENGVSANPAFFQMQFIESMAESSKFSDDPAFCLKYFNPTTKSKYSEVVASWTNALAELSIKSREIPVDAASKASASRLQSLLRTKAPSALHQQEAKTAQTPFVMGVEMIALLVAIYLAIKYYKMRNLRKNLEAAPFAAQARPVQISD